MGFAGRSWLGLSRESLAKSNLSTFHNKSHKNTEKWLNRITIKFDTELKPTCQWLFKFQHVLLTWLVLWVISRESVASPVVKTTSLQILYQTLTHSPYIKSHKNKGKSLNRITIKFDMELNPTKKYSCKSQLYNLPLWLFYDKTPKQTLNSKH